jgi:hypothetical protein
MTDKELDLPPNELPLLLSNSYEARMVIYTAQQPSKPSGEFLVKINRPRDL